MFQFGSEVKAKHLALGLQGRSKKLFVFCTFVRLEKRRLPVAGVVKRRKCRCVWVGGSSVLKCGRLGI